MKKKNIVICITVLSLAITIPAYAKVTNHPIFPTKEEVQQWISDAVNNLEQRLNLIETAVTGNTQEIQNINTHISEFESQIAQIKKVIFEDDFAGTSVDTSKWVPTDGWSENLVLTVDGGEIGYTKKSDFSDFTLGVDFQINGRSDYNSANFILRQAPNNPYVGTYYMVQLTSKTSQFSPNSIRISRGPHILDKVIPIPFEIKNGDWHHLRIVVKEYTFSLFVDGKFMGRYVDNIRTTHTGDSMRTEGAIGIYAHGIPGNIYSDLVNYANLEVSQ